MLCGEKNRPKNLTKMSKMLYFDHVEKRIFGYLHLKNLLLTMLLSNKHCFYVRLLNEKFVFDIEHIYFLFRGFDVREVISQTLRTIEFSDTNGQKMMRRMSYVDCKQISTSPTTILSPKYVSSDRMKKMLHFVESGALKHKWIVDKQKKYKE